jgi:3-deoxy-D-manno-octulosonic acid kinase
MTTPVAARDFPFTGGALRFDATRIREPGPGLFTPSHTLQAAPVSHGGRQAAWFVQGDFGAGVLRHYRRGGAIARISADRYIWMGETNTRSIAEFDLLRFMHARGLAVPRPLAAAWWRLGMTYRAAILVERIQGAQPLANVLQDADPARVARTIFDMHEAGVWHADLNAYNILLDQNQVWLIDFDRGRRAASLSLARRHSNLLRLRRSLVKVRSTQGLEWWGGIDLAYARLLKAKERM